MKQVNLYEIIKILPADVVFYSTIIGKCKIRQLKSEDNEYPIIIENDKGVISSLDKYGKYFSSCGECTLFLNSENRDWKSEDSKLFIFHHLFKEN